MPLDTSLTVEIQAIPLFASMSTADIDRLEVALQLRHFAQGDVLIHEGEPGDFFYILLSGHVEIVKALNAVDQRLLAIHGPGDFVGEMSLINPDGLRTASVRANEPVRALELGRTQFEELLSRHPSLALEPVRVLSRHLDLSNNATIRDLREKNRLLSEAYQALQATQARLIESEKLEHELALAREIQQSILPATLPVVANVTFGARMLPARAVGGDLYDFIRLDEHRIGIAVGDVSDKGVPAALFMALTTSLLRAEAQRSDTPAAVLHSVNRHLLGMNASNMFVTMLYGILDMESHTFTYARAGHELPLIFDAELKPQKLSQQQGLPLGILTELMLDEQQVTLAPGSRLVMHTDGVTDALNVSEQRFGYERLVSAANIPQITMAQELCDNIVQSVRKFAAQAAQFDDITVATVVISETQSG